MFRTIFSFLIVVALTLASTTVAFAAKSPFKNIDEIAQSLNLATYAQSKGVRTVKIAILDNGFRGYKSQIGRTLPRSTKYHGGPVAVDAKAEDVHGLFMAQIVSGLLAKTPGISYELHLFSAFGYSNLNRAVDSVVDGKFDVVLYSQVWEYGGNGDGRGFINAAINRGAASGAIWINAAGNFGDATYRGAVEKLEDDWAYLPSLNRGVRVRCFENAKNKCNLRAVLSWNSFSDDVNKGTDKDLDLVLTDDTLKVIRTGGLQQVKKMSDGGSGQSLYPREIIEAELRPGIYELRVKVRSGNFTKAADELRIVTSGDYLEQLDRNSADESMLAPADNSSVITVSASDSEKSSRSISRGKPEVSRASAMVLENDETYKGSSNSAAMSAAVAVIFKALEPSADRQAVIDFLNGRRSAPTNSGASNYGRGLPLSVLAFRALGPAGCFQAAILPSIPEAAQGVLQTGAVSVTTSAGLKIMTAEDPFTLGFGVTRKRESDMLIVSDKGFTVRPRSAQVSLPAGSYEVLQLPENTTYCSF